MIKRLNELILVLTPVCVLYGVLYNAAYFSLVDWRLLTILSAEDYLVSTILFIPFTAIQLLFYSCQMIRSLRNSADVANSRRYTWVRHLFWPIMITLLAISVMMTESSNYYLVTLLAPLFVNNLLDEINVFRSAPELRLPVLIFIYGAFVSAAIGFSHAHADLGAIHASHFVKVKNADAAINVFLCRSISRGIIVNDLKGLSYITYLPWDDVEKISHVSMAVGDKKRACEWFGLMCL